MAVVSVFTVFAVFAIVSVVAVVGSGLSWGVLSGVWFGVGHGHGIGYRQEEEDGAWVETHGDGCLDIR